MKHRRRLCYHFQTLNVYKEYENKTHKSVKALLSDVESDSDDLFIFRVSLRLESEIELLPPLSLCIHLGSITNIMQDTEPST